MIDFTARKAHNYYMNAAYEAHEDTMTEEANEARIRRNELAHARAQLDCVIGDIEEHQNRISELETLRDNLFPWVESLVEYDVDGVEVR